MTDREAPAATPAPQLAVERLQRALLGSFGNFGTMGDDPEQHAIRAEDTARLYERLPEGPVDSRGHRIGNRRFNGPGAANNRRLAARSAKNATYVTIGGTRMPSSG